MSKPEYIPVPQYEVKRISLLNKGLIPPRTPCPYKSRCMVLEQNGCVHKGVGHTVSFSCAMARALEMFPTIGADR